MPRTATTRRQRSRPRRSRWSACATCRIDSGRRPGIRSWSSSRASMRPARTARSRRSWRRSTRRAVRSPRSRCRRRRSSPTTSCGGSTSARRARARSGSSIGRTTRTSSWSASTASAPRRVWSKRYDQINAFERDAGRGGHDHRQVLPGDRSRRAAQAHPVALRRPEEALEVHARRPRGAQALGRLPGRLRRRLEQDVDAVAHRGTSSRPTATGSATSSVATILADTIADLRPAYPKPADLPPNLVIE